MPDSVVGLMIDSDKVRAVELQRWRGRHPKVVRAGEVPLSASSVMQGAILEPEAVSLALETLWRNEGFGTKQVVVALDGRQAIVRRTELPVGKPDRLRRAAGFDIEELLSYPLDEAIFDVAQIETFVRPASGSASRSVSDTGSDTNEWTSALVVAVHETTRQGLMEIVSAAGLKPIAVHLASESLARSVMVSELKETSDLAGVVSAIINVGDSHTDVVIRDDGGTLFSRTLAVGVGETALNVADELESQLQGLTGYRSRTDDKTESERRASAAQAGVATVVEGVRRTLTYYQSELDKREIGCLVLSGTRAEAVGLQSAMAAAFGSRVQLAQAPVLWLESLGHWHGYATAVGAVLCESRSGHKGRYFSLVPRREQEKRAESHRVLAGIGLATLAIAIFLNIDLSRKSLVAEQEAIANEAEAIRADVVRQIASYDDLVAEFALMQDSTSQINQLLEQEIEFPSVLQELAQNMPQESQLVSIQMGRAVPGQEVVGYIGADPVGVLSLSALAPDTAGVGAFVVGMESNTLSEGFWLSQSSVGPIGVSEEIGASFSADGIIAGAAQPRSAFFPEGLAS